LSMSGNDEPGTERKCPRKYCTPSLGRPDRQNPPANWSTVWNGGKGPGKNHLGLPELSLSWVARGRMCCTTIAGPARGLREMLGRALKAAFSERAGEGPAPGLADRQWGFLFRMKTANPASPGGQALCPWDGSGGPVSTPKESQKTAVPCFF
jgi:hypothetical protein